MTERPSMEVDVSDELCGKALELILESAVGFLGECLVCSCFDALGVMVDNAAVPLEKGREAIRMTKQASGHRVVELFHQVFKGGTLLLEDLDEVAAALLRRVSRECLHVLETGNLSEGDPPDPMRTWLDTTFRDALLDDERVMKSAALLKVAMERGDPGVEVCRWILGNFVKTLVEEG